MITLFKILLLWVQVKTFTLLKSVIKDVSVQLWIMRKFNAAQDKLNSMAPAADSEAGAS